MVPVLILHNNSSPNNRARRSEAKKDRLCSLMGKDGWTGISRVTLELETRWDAVPLQPTNHPARRLRISILFHHAGRVSRSK
jgi:hypothetical protein